MKVLRCCLIILVSTLIFASCKPNGRILYYDTIAGTPTKADTVLTHKFHTNKDSANIEVENVPMILKR